MLCVSQGAWATVSIQGGGGVGIGTLKAHQDFSVRAYPVHLILRYEARPFNLVSLTLGAIIERQTITYQAEDITYEGLNLLAGASWGWNLWTFQDSFLRLEASYFPQSELTFSTNNSYTVNQSTFRHSTLRTYRGEAASQIDINYIFELKDRPFDKYERGRWGVAVSYLRQPLKEVTTNIATSNRAIGPKSENATAVTYEYSLLALRLVFGFAF